MLLCGKDIYTVIKEATQKLVVDFLSIVKPIPIWIDGGWGVDALLGRQTRVHSDLDIVVSADDWLSLESKISNNGFSPDSAQEGLVFVSSIGLQIDVHCVRFDSDGYGNFDLPDGSVWPFPPAAFRGVGTIGFLDVQCLSPEAQVQCHAQGYQPTKNDLRDMNELQKQYEVVLPFSLCTRGIRH